MRYLSVCSGIEAASAAWHQMGWQPAAFSEIEPFPSAVLAHHYPNVPNVGDMTKYEDWNVGQIDLLVGGTPCQAFSVAGLRGGLSDARGNLSLVFCKMADHFDPDYVLWENVPGVLSSTDNAFGCFLAGLCGASEPLAPGRKWSNAGVVSGPKRTVAWRVLDAQFFGVAQRRRRVFVLAVRGAGNWAAARALFPVGEGVFWNSAPSRKAREAVAGTLEASLGRSRGAGTPSSAVTAHRMVAFGEYSDDGSASAMKAQDHKDATDLVVTHSLRGEGFDASEDGTGRGTPLVPCLAPTLTSNGDANSGYRDEHGLVPVLPVTYDLFNVTAPVNRQNRTPGDPCHTLARSNAEHAAVVAPSLTASNDPSRSPQSSEVTQQVWAVMQATQAIGFDAYNNDVTGDVSKTIDTGQDYHHVPNVLQAVAFALQHAQIGRKDSAGPQGKGWQEGLAFTQDSRSCADAVATAMQVRRLTPRECERLQGFPDDYTLVPNRGKPAADGPRYKALGNSMAVPVMRWIGERIQGVQQ